MKKGQKAVKEFDKLRIYLRQMEHAVKDAKTASLWHFEAGIRRKVRTLSEFSPTEFRDYASVRDRYLKLLDQISKRLIEFYNRKNGTDYRFEEIIENNQKAYLSAGIMSVLITSHIPKLIAQDFDTHFPENPKDEYPLTRLIKRKVYLHLGDTNTGKTYNAIERLKQAGHGAYLAPLRILALENYERLNSEGVACNLVTGEEELLVEGASHVSSTIEKLNVDDVYDVAVIDEIQMIGNFQRGGAWTRALLGLKAKEIHVCGALNTKELLTKILQDLGDDVEIEEYKRNVPLEIVDTPFELRHAAKGDALVAFSKKRVLELSKNFAERGIQVSVIYGDLPPEVRRMQYDAFRSGDSDILVTTDAIGMGVNLPIKRIIFMSMQKFDGEEVRYLTSQEVKQIGGRAGRKGIYEVGYVGAYTIDQLYIRECLESADESVSQAVVSPSEAILKIGKLPLGEKIALWSTRQEKLDTYRKMDVSDYLLILDLIKKFKLPEAVEYKLMNLPFDVNNLDVQECFIDYVAEYFKSDSAGISKPRLTSPTLTDYETYYQKVNLYYSFAKNFKIEFDEKWVYREREKISVKINELLLKL